MAGTKTAGFIGLGAMGRGLAGNLVRKGFGLTVWDPVVEATDRLVAAGAKSGTSAADVARRVDVVFTMVPDAPEVKNVALGSGGIIDGAHPGLIYVDLSTIDPTTSRAVGEKLKSAGIRMLDSPVGRGVPEAEAGTVTLMVGGDADTLDEVRPLLEAFSSEIMHIGGLGAGTTIKLVNNYLASGFVATIMEALSLGIPSGVTLEQIIALSDKTGTSNKLLNTVLRNKAFLGDFTPGFVSRLAAKDHRLAMGLAGDLGVDLPIGRAVLGLLESCERDFANEDFMGSVLRRYEEGAGMPLRLGQTKQA